MPNLLKKVDLGFIPFILLTALIILKIALSYYTFGVNIGFDRWLYFISAAVSLSCLYFACKAFRYFKLYSAILAILFVANCGLELAFDPIDECAHFEYITHIAEKHELPVWGGEFLASAVNSVNFDDTTPSSINHESIQAPFYYLVLAVFGSFIDNSVASLVIYRLIGLLFVGGIVFVCNKLAKQLFGLSIKDSPMFRLLLLLTFLSPGYIFRAGRLNNEIMACLLFMFLLYQYFFTFLDNKSYRYWLVSLFAVLIFLTKNTAIYCIALPILLFVFHIKDPRRKTVFVSLVVCGLIALPWFIFNYVNYHALTGVQKNLDFARGIVDPDHLGVDFIHVIFVDLPGTFYSGYSLGFAFHPITNHLIAFIYFALLVIFSVLSYKSISHILNVRKTTVALDKSSIGDSVTVALACLATFLTLCYGYRNYIDDGYLNNPDKGYLILSLGLVLLVFLSVFFFRITYAIIISCRISVRMPNLSDRKNMYSIVNISCVAVLLMAIMVLIAGSITSSLNSILSRYMYPVVPALCILILNNKDNLILVKIRKSLKAMALIMLAFVSVDAFSGLIYKSMSYRGWLADGAAGFTVSRSADRSNWNNGVSKEGKQIVLDYTPNTDYSRLKGRVFFNNGEYAYIDDVRREWRYEYLYLKNKINSQKATNAVWLNTGRYLLKKYNGIQSARGKINGSLLSQSFKVKADSLFGFSVMVATYGHNGVPVKVNYKLVDSSSENVITKGNYFFPGINDNQWIEILFSSPVSVTRNGKYRIEFSLDSPEGKNLGIYVTKNDFYTDGEFNTGNPDGGKEIDLGFGLIQN